MQISWAAFGERNGGHALLASSQGSGFASKITQYTDRPGDPPFGLQWGPITSGFFYLDHYILLRIISDPTAGRAGMVRSYAAFLTIEQLTFCQNVTCIFDALPSDIRQLNPNIQPIEVPDALLKRKSLGSNPNVVETILNKLYLPQPDMPIVLAVNEAYLPIVDALWAKLPTSLRPAFGFSYQFAPEHRLPAKPTIIATDPTLALRWPSGQIIQAFDSSYVQTRISGQKWANDQINDIVIREILDNYGMSIRQFSEIDIHLSFVDMISRLETVDFSEARKGMRILEKHSKLTNATEENRKLFCQKFCSLILGCSPQEVKTFRNLDSKELSDLIPLIQNAVRDWIRNAVTAANGLNGLKSTFELAVTNPGLWWSVPFVEWLAELAGAANRTHVYYVWNLVLESNCLTTFLEPQFFKHRNWEAEVLAAMPAELSKEQIQNIISLSVKAGWMQAHAKCLLRTRSQTEAIVEHGSIAGSSTEGFDLIYQAIGFKPFLIAACGNESPTLDQYVSQLIRHHSAELSDDEWTSCSRWLRLLAGAIYIQGQIPAALARHANIAFATPAHNPDGFRMLAEACIAKAIGIIISLENPDLILDNLPESRYEDIITRIDTYILGELLDGKKIEVSEEVCELITISNILETLGKVPRMNLVEVGLNAFRCIKVLTDSDFKSWLIALFTCSSNDPIKSLEAEEIGLLLLERDFPISAGIIRDTVYDYGRRDVAPILDKICYKYQMAKRFDLPDPNKSNRLPKVLIATALPLERTEVMRHIVQFEYIPELFADHTYWPHNNPEFEVYVLTTGAGNVEAQSATFAFLSKIKPKFAFFVGVGGGVKDSDIGDVVYGTKIYFIEGAKEEFDGIKSRPNSEKTSEEIVQLAHRIAETNWQPNGPLLNVNKPKATPAVVASGEKVLASTDIQASNYQNLKSHYNDTQVVDMEGYGFLKSLRSHNIRLCMVIRGVSDKIKNKGESDAQGNQPLAAQNAAAFLFALLGSCPGLLSKKGKKSLKSIALNFEGLD